MLAGHSAAHAAGVVHRDLKPENVFLAREHGQETVKLVDFGIAKIRSTDPQQVSLTQTGQILGSPLYMAPEQGRSTARVDARADVYAVGCIVFELLTGCIPNPGKTVVECVLGHATEPIPRAEELRRGIPEAVLALVRRAMAKSPEDRFASAREMATEWEAAWDGTSQAASPSRSVAPAAERAEPTDDGRARGGWKPVAVGVAVVGLLGVAALVATRDGASGAAPGAERVASTREDGGAAPTRPTVARAARDAGAAPSARTAPIRIPGDGGEGQAAVVRAVESEPAGAEVWIDGARVGRAPFEVTLVDGAREIELRLPGRTPVARRLTTGDPNVVRVVLPRRAPRVPATRSSGRELAPL